MSPRSALIGATLPILVGLGPILHLWSRNASVIPLESVMVLIGLVAAAGLVLTIGVTLITRDTTRSGCAIAAVAVPFMTFGFQRAAVDGPEPATTLLLLVANAGGVTAMVAWVWRHDPTRAARSATVVALIFAGLSIPGIAIGLHGPLATPSSGDARRGEGPDVYYIVLDAYGRHDVFRDLYGFDNRPFLRELQSRGFFIGDRSYSNYALTQQSLASALAGHYLTMEVAMDNRLLHEAIGTGQVIQDFKSHGYDYIAFKTSWWGTAEAPLADIEFEGSLNEFHRVLWRATLPGSLLYTPTSHEAVLATFDRLPEIARLPQPTFTFAHLLVPHPPYMFRNDGTVVSYIDSLSDAGGTVDEYIGQVQFLNTLVLEAIDAILAASQPRPLIIIQGDHGNAFALGARADPETVYWERHAILNAFLFPEPMASELYPSISPVNTFRVVAHGLWDDPTGPIDDRSYFSWYEAIDSDAVRPNPQELIEVTGLLDAREPAR